MRQWRVWAWWGWLVAQAGAVALSLVLFWQRGSLLTNLALWPVKMVAGTAVNFLFFSHVVTAVLGLRQRRAWLGGLGAGLALLMGRYLYVITRVTAPFTAVFGQNWEADIPPYMRENWLRRRWYLHLPAPAPTHRQRDVVYGQSAAGQPLTANLWQPRPGAPRSGLALVNVHGGAWVYGQKNGDLAYLLQRLAAQGHVVLDIDYSKYPAVNLVGMVREVQQALAWLKVGAGGHIPQLPEKLALLGTSAGGHVALLAAYAAQEPAFRPLDPALAGVDTAVCGLIAYYPPSDLRMLNAYVQTYYGASRQETIVPRTENLIIWNINRHLAAEGSAQTIPPGWGNFIPALVCGTPQETPEL
ncbi:MAG: alpha/beta hydrolase, partial [Anaerolineales bacterium]|nr:alpha/beta hydrolase [Anaerolineales bacterium]